MRASAGGWERYVLGLALLIPLTFAVLTLTQVPGVSLAAPTTLLRADGAPNIASKRPAASSALQVPPTLAPATPTPRPTVTPVPPTPQPKVAATPQKGGTYTVQPGDELRHIAADYHVSIWKIIAANDIPDPDSLRIGQVLRIAED